MSNLTLHTYDEPRPDTDELLHEYFQAEMPKPWPSFKAPRVRETPSVWSRYSGRIALAACVTLLIAAYWSLSGPTLVGETPPGLHRVGPPIGAGHGKTKKATPVQHNVPNDQLVPMGPTPQSK